MTILQRVSLSTGLVVVIPVEMDGLALDNHQVTLELVALGFEVALEAAESLILSHICNFLSV